MADGPPNRDGSRQITMTEDLALPGRTAIHVMNASIERKRVIRQMRERVRQLREGLAQAEADLRVEESELAQEAALVEQLMEQWSVIVDEKFREATEKP